MGLKNKGRPISENPIKERKRVSESKSQREIQTNEKLLSQRGKMLLSQRWSLNVYEIMKWTH